METENIFKQVSDKLENNIKLSNVKEEVFDKNIQPIVKDKNPILLDSRFFCDTCPYATNRSYNLKSHKYRKHGSMKNIVKVKKMDKEIKQFGHKVNDKIGQKDKSKKCQANNFKKNVKKVSKSKSKDENGENSVKSELEKKIRLGEKIINVLQKYDIIKESLNSMYKDVLDLFVITDTC